MSALHLAKGSEQPAKVEGKLRLYSMQFCPFAERVRLVLLAKNLPHDVVNVHLKNKPDWIFELHPEGKVPALDTGSQVVIESIDISDFLDEHYPSPPLYPTDPEKRQEDKAIISKLGELIVLYYKAAHNVDHRPLSEHVQNMSPHLEQLEKQLQNRGRFFGGDQPGMVDYMLWPWGERAPVLGLIYKQELPGAKDFPLLCAWCEAMRGQGAVKETITSPERLFKLHQQYAAGPEAVDYESI